MFSKMKTTYNQFPRTFWLVALTSFIDQIGNFLLMPFIALYITAKFDVGMLVVGTIFTVVGIGNLFGSLIGGSLTDKIGRKQMILFGLVVSGIFNLSVIFVNRLSTLYIVIILMGFLGSLGGPARGALMADILKPEQRTEGFGILRITMNLAATIGPALGGFLAGYSFNILFIADAITSAITGIIFFLYLPETNPTLKETEVTSENNIHTIETAVSEVPLDSQVPTTKSKKMGYKEVLRDGKFMLFVAVSSIMSLVYLQMNSTLSVFLRDEHGLSTTTFGWMISMNAFMVVIMQFWITKKIKIFPGLIMMAVGNILYGVGFGMYGLISTVPLFFVAMIIITIAEMVVTPFAQTLTANFAPEDKRGRYMAVFQFTGLIPTLFGVIGAGAIMDNFNPNIIWYLCGILSVVAALGYYALHFIMKNSSITEVEDQNQHEFELLSPISSDELNIDSVVME